MTLHGAPAARWYGSVVPRRRVAPLHMPMQASKPNAPTTAMNTGHMGSLCTTFIERVTPGSLSEEPT